MRLLFTILLTLATSLWSQTSAYFQQAVTYKIDVALNAEEKTYSGTEELSYTNNSPDALDFIWIHLYPNAYKDNSTPFAKQEERVRSTQFHFSKESERGWLNIVSIKASGDELKTELKADAIDEMKVYLPQALQPGQTIVLEMLFEGKFPTVFSRMGTFKNKYFAATQWYPKAVVYDRDGWHPDSYLNMGEFYGEFGHYDVSITLPESFAIDATGLLQDNPQEQAFIDSLVAAADSIIVTKSEKDRKKMMSEWDKKRSDSIDYDKLKTVRFMADNVHDFAWFAGPYLMLRSRHNNDVLTQVLVIPNNVYSWREVPKYVEQTVWFYGKTVGKYQYPKASVVDGALEAGGGMEYPMITIVSVQSLDFMKLLEMVVMHEVGHNWFYGMLGSNERTSAFLDEGMNSFVEMKYMEHFYGKNNLTDFKKLFKGHAFLQDIGEWHLSQLSYGIQLSQQIDQPLNIRAEEFTPANYGGINYQKGAALLYALEFYLGPEVFDRALHTYFEEWNGRHPRYIDFFEVMGRVSGQDLTWFVDAWYKSTQYNDFKISKIIEKQDNGRYETDVYVLNNGTMQGMPAPVTLITTDGDTLVGRWTGDAAKPVHFEHTSVKKYAEVNHERQIFENHFINNRSGLPQVDWNFVIPQIPRFDTYPVNIMPYVWYNGAVDKTRLGLWYWSGNPVINEWFTRGSLYYGLESQKIGYSLTISNRFRSAWANYLDAEISGQDKSGLQSYGVTLANHFESRSDETFRQDVKLSLDYMNVHDLRYTKPGIFSDIKYSTVNLSYKTDLRRMLWRLSTEVNVEKAVRITEDKIDYTKWWVYAGYNRKLSRNSLVRFSGYAGSFTGDRVPQELFYALGDIDPKQKQFAFGRRSDLSVWGYWKFDRGLNMYGYSDIQNPYFAARNGASASMDLKVKYLPTLYGSAAVLGNELADLTDNHVFAETGLKLDLTPFSFVFPVYISDPAPSENRLAFRMKFHVKLVF